MFNKDIQYISAIKYNTQLKIDYKKFRNNELEIMNHSNFISKDEIMSSNLAFKLNQWQKDVNDTYISSLILDNSEKIVSKSEARRLNNYNKSYLNQKQDIVVNKEKLFEHKHYFEKTGIDYIFSPFQVLNYHFEQNPSSNHISVLTIDSKSYLLILNKDGEIAYNKVIDLTSFKEVQGSNFFSNEVVGQKLFDELYFLELLKAIKEALKEYYEKKSGTFIEHISILYTAKQLNDEQLKKFEDELMIKVSYHSISLSEIIHDLTRDKNVSLKSFTKARVKLKSSYLSNIIIALLLASFAFLIYLFFQKDINRFIKEEKTLISSSENKKEIKFENKLSNHINKNRVIEQHILTFIDSIPYSVVLKQLEVKKDNSLLIISMLKEDAFLKHMQPRYLEIYKYSNIKFKDEKATVLEATIYNNDMLENLYGSNEKMPKYILDEFMPIKRVTEHLRAIFPSDSIVTFKSKFKSNIMTYNYSINIVVQNPMQFFEFVEDLNKELYSINISYPISFIKSEDGIEVDFNLQFHQNN